MLNIKLDSQLLSLYNSEKREKKSFSFIFNSQLFLGNIYMRERERETIKDVTCFWNQKYLTTLDSFNNKATEKVNNNYIYCRGKDERTLQYGIHGFLSKNGKTR